ncbi:MAG: VirB4 family type IV secretion system protein, partial [Alphaproteobacteria bacterium]|nr:VirB4 family type IV secretion system protein [Alphaproteobacteria bacterium]
INEFALLGITARFFGVKRLKDISHQAEWQSPALKEIGDAESETFKRAYEIRWFMVLQCKTYRNLGEISEKIFSTYKVYKPKLLKTPIDKSKPCPLTCFLNYLVCGDLRDDLKAVSSNISGNLQGADTIWDREAGTMTAHIPLPYIYKSVTVTSWSDMINGAIINSIMNLKGELEVSQVLKPVKKERMTASFARKARETNANPFGNKALAEECTAAVALLSEGELSFYQTQFCINIRAKNLEKLNTLLESLTASLAKDGLRYSIETECMPISWFNRFAGRDRLARPLKLRNDDIAALWAWQFAPIGLIKSYWSNQPVRSFATASGQAYAFQFQATEAKKALGNFAVFAPSGVGKSTLIMHLFGGLAKNKNFKTFILDSKEGARYMIEAMGGVYQSYDKLALNPLDVSEDTPSTRMHISKIVRTMIGDVEKSEDMDELIAHLLDTAFTLPVEHRTFNGLFDLCFSRQTDLRRSFRKWVTDNKGNKGFYSHIFNSKRDTLSSFLGDSFMVGINMNEALENPELAAPIVTHISTAIERIAQQGTLDG